jgi:RNA polymerase sigma factor (sigma-70 family)
MIEEDLIIPKGASLMGRGQFEPVVHQLRHLFEGRSIAGVSEWQLLHRYLDGRDEVAFEAIVARHGPMVLGVCRRILADARDVEDAFQATFVVLARKGGTLAETDPVGHWLYGVAYRVALRARASAARRRRLEGSATPLELARSDDRSSLDLGEVIDEELARLPSKYRSPVVLCYLEGQTHEEAARQLGWPLGTVKGRLARARELLKGRLARRGVAPGGLLGLVRGSRVAVPRPLLDLTMRAAEAGRSAGEVPAAVASLVAGSLSTMFMNKLKAAGIVVLVLGTGAAVMAYQATKVASRAQSKEHPASSKEAQGPSMASADVTDWVAGWPDLTTKPDNDPKTKAIHKVLEEPLTMNFGTDTPLSDVIKYIKDATQRPEMPKGLIIYVDPAGLQDADKTIADTVVIELEDVPLKHTLALLLKQLTLRYVVKDGLLTITNSNPEDEITPFSIMEEKARKGELTRQQYQQLIEALKLKREVEKLVSYEDKSGSQ